MAADRPEHDLGRRREPRGLALQRRGVEEAERDAEPVRDGAHRRLVRLQVEGGDAGDCLGREPAGGQRALGQLDQLVGRAAPLAAETRRQDRGMQRDIGRVVARHRTPVGDAHCEAARVREGGAAGGEPVGRCGLGHQAHRLTGEQRGGDRLHPRALTEAPARQAARRGRTPGPCRQPW